MKLALLEWCLQARLATPSMETADDWLQCWQQLSFADTSALQLAIQGGFQADRVAWAFASGYQAALRAQFPLLTDSGVYAFCLTEQGVRSSRSLQSRWRQMDSGIQLQGNKGWTPLFQQCSAFLVACRGEVEEGQEASGLRVLRVPADAAGVAFNPREPSSFMPELPTARMQLDGVQLKLNALLPGDGWQAYAKPFSILEELYVSAALLAYLLREGRSNAWPVSYLQQLLAALALLGELADVTGEQAISRVALSGATAWARQLFTEAGALWAASPEDARAQRWLRDKPIQTLWASSSEQRGAKAWQSISQIAP